MRNWECKRLVYESDTSGILFVETQLFLFSMSTSRLHRKYSTSTFCWSPGPTCPVTCDFLRWWLAQQPSKWNVVVPFGVTGYEPRSQKPAVNGRSCELLQLWTSRWKLWHRRIILFCQKENQWISTVDTHVFPKMLIRFTARPAQCVQCVPPIHVISPSRRFHRQYQRLQGASVSTSFHSRGSLQYVSIFFCYRANALLHLKLPQTSFRPIKKIVFISAWL